MEKAVSVIALLTIPLRLSQTYCQQGQKPEAWSPSMIKRLITDSAWAKPVTVQIKGENWDAVGTRPGSANAEGGPVAMADGTNASVRMPAQADTGSVARP